MKASYQIFTAMKQPNVSQNRNKCFTIDYERESYLFEKHLSESKRMFEGRELMPHIVHAIKLSLVNPATSCTTERSFSTARRLKTSPRATMKSRRLNSLAILNIHKDTIDRLDLKAIGNEFLSTRGQRFEYFGKFVQDKCIQYFFSDRIFRIFRVTIFSEHFPHSNFSNFLCFESFNPDLISEYELDLKRVLANLKDHFSKIFLARRPQPWQNLLIHFRFSPSTFKIVSPTLEILYLSTR